MRVNRFITLDTKYKQHNPTVFSHMVAGQAGTVVNVVKHHQLFLPSSACCSAELLIITVGETLEAPF